MVFQHRKESNRFLYCYQDFATLISTYFRLTTLIMRIDFIVKPNKLLSHCLFLFNDIPVK